MRIQPGKPVLADLDGYDEPVVRLYRAKRPHAAGATFELVAQNPAFDVIAVDDPAECRSIGCIFGTFTFFGNQT